MLSFMLLLSCPGASASAKNNDLEGFDEEPIVVQQAIKAKAKAAADAAASASAAKSDTQKSDTKPAAIAEDLGAAAPVNSTKQQQQSVFQTQEKYLVEAVALAALIAYLINILSGRRVNQRIAYAWAAAFASPGGVFDRNFSYIGPSSSSNDCVELIKDSGNIFKLYASGELRREACTLLCQLVCFLLCNWRMSACMLHVWVPIFLDCMAMLSVKRSKLIRCWLVIAWTSMQQAISLCLNKCKVLTCVIRTCVP